MTFGRESSGGDDPRRTRARAITAQRGIIECPLGYVDVTGKPFEADPTGKTDMPGRYDEQLIELSRIVRGEIANPYPLAHELMVQEALLVAIGHPPLE